MTDVRNYWQLAPQCCPNCEAFAACFNGEVCLQMKFTGFADCIDLNQTVVMTMGTGILPSNVGIPYEWINCWSGGGVPMLAVEDHPIPGDVGVYVRTPTCDPVPRWSFYVGVSTRVDPVQVIDFGLYPIIAGGETPEQSQTNRDIIHTLCTGGTVTLPGHNNPLFFGDDCNPSGSQVELSLVPSGEECVGEPPTSPCDAYMHCPGLFMAPMALQLEQFDDCEYDETLPSIGDVHGHRQWTVLNYDHGAGIQWELLVGANPYSICSDTDVDTLTYSIKLGRDDTSDYSDPGILLDSLDIDTSHNYHREVWIWAMSVVIVCDQDTGKAKIKRLMLDVQTWSGADASWPPTTTGGAISGCIMLDEETFGEIHPTNPATGCGVLGTMLNAFNYAGCDLGGTENEHFVIECTV